MVLRWKADGKMVSEWQKWEQKALERGIPWEASQVSPYKSQIPSNPKHQVLWFESLCKHQLDPPVPSASCIAECLSFLTAREKENVDKRFSDQETQSPGGGRVELLGWKLGRWSDVPDRALHEKCSALSPGWPRHLQPVFQLWRKSLCDPCQGMGGLKADLQTQVSIPPTKTGSLTHQSAQKPASH